MGSPHLATIVGLASRQPPRMALIHYRKGATGETLHPRLIEPYSIDQGKQDIMIRAFQIDPETGWRFFMLHKIEACEDAGVDFRPRRKISIPTGEVQPTYTASPAWTPGRAHYRDLVVAALSDSVLTEHEHRAIAQCRLDHRLGNDDIRFVHAGIYSRCLSMILADDFFADDEARELHLLHRLLHNLGWAVGD